MRTLIALAVAGLVPAAFGSTLFTDSFDYPADAPLPSPWATTNTQGETGMWVGSSSNLSFPGLTTSGGAAHTTNRFTTARAAMNGSIAVAGGNTTNTFYLSYLLRLDVDSDWGETLNVGVTNSVAGDRSGFYAGLYKTSGVTHFGLSAGARPENGAGASVVLDPLVVTPGGNVYFVLAKFEVDTGDLWSDVAGGARGYLNVYTGAVPTSEPSTWQLSVTANKGWPFTSDATMNQAILSRANIGQDATIDELRVATTFAEVAPVPEPTSALALMGTTGLLALRRRAIR